MLTKNQTLAEYQLEEYIRLGFTEYEARRLMDVPVSVSEIRELIRKGCSTKLAYRIKRP